MSRSVSRFLLGAALLLVAVRWPSFADSNWWNAAWPTRRKLTFNNAAQATNLVGFPILVRLDSSRVDYTRTQDAGQDVRFVDADNLTILPHEIEKWDESGSSYVWVKVPQVDAASTTDCIYMYFGNPSAGDGQSAAGVWDTNFKMVHHFRETSGQHQDSTNNNDSSWVDVSVQGTAAGRFNGADSFVRANNDFIEVADADSLDAAAGESLTVEAWVQSSSTANDMVAVSKKQDYIAEYQLWMPNGNAAFWVNYDPDDWDVLEYFARVNSTVNVRNGSWHYLVGRWNGASKTADLFVDGTAAGTPVANTNIVSLSNSNPLVIGEDGGSARSGNFDGILDEIRVRRFARSDDWIRAQNLSMTDNFITFGSEPTHRLADVTARCGVDSTHSPLDKTSQRKVVRDEDLTGTSCSAASGRRAAPAAAPDTRRSASPGRRMGGHLDRGRPLRVGRPRLRLRQRLQVRVHRRQPGRGPAARGRAGPAACRFSTRRTSASRAGTRRAPGPTQTARGVERTRGPSAWTARVSPGPSRPPRSSR